MAAKPKRAYKSTAYHIISKTSRADTKMSILIN